MFTRMRSATPQRPPSAARPSDEANWTAAPPVKRPPKAPPRWYAADGLAISSWVRVVRSAALVVGMLALVPATAAATPNRATVFTHSAKSGELRGGRLTLRGV